MPSLQHHRCERGEGRIKFLLSLAVIAGIVYVVMQFIPVYLHNLQMEDETQRIVSQAALQNLQESEVHNRLAQKAVEYQLPDNTKIEIRRNGKKVSARVAYTQTVALPYYTYTWPFEIRKEDSAF